MSNILLKVLIVVALILAWLVFYSYKLIHEKPIHEEENRVVVKSVVMPHPPLSDKSRKQDKKIDLDENNESQEVIESSEQNTTTVELTPDIPQEELEISADEPEIVINDETEIIDDNEEEGEWTPVEEPPLVNSDGVEVIEEIPQQEQAPIVDKQTPNIDLGRPIGKKEEREESVDLGVQLF